MGVKGLFQALVKQYPGIFQKIRFPPKKSEAGLSA
jgi:hypothetical protein